MNCSVAELQFQSVAIRSCSTNEVQKVCQELNVEEGNCKSFLQELELLSLKARKKASESNTSRNFLERD